MFLQRDGIAEVGCDNIGKPSRSESFLLLDMTAATQTAKGAASILPRPPIPQKFSFEFQQ